MYAYPWIYHYNFPKKFMDKNPNVAKVLKGVHVTEAPYNNTATLVSSAGQKFLSFAKCSNYNAGKTHV